MSAFQHLGDGSNSTRNQLRQSLHISWITSGQYLGDDQRSWHSPHTSWRSAGQHLGDLALTLQSSLDTDSSLRNTSTDTNSCFVVTEAISTNQLQLEIERLKSQLSSKKSAQSHFDKHKQCRVWNLIPKQNQQLLQKTNGSAERGT